MSNNRGHVNEVYILHMEVNNGNKSDITKKIEKNKVIQKWWIYYYEKSTLKRLGFNKPSSGL